MFLLFVLGEPVLIWRIERKKYHRQAECIERIELTFYVESLEYLVKFEQNGISKYLLFTFAFILFYKIQIIISKSKVYTLQFDYY